MTEQKKKPILMDEDIPELDYSAEQAFLLAQEEEEQAQID